MSEDKDRGSVMILAIGLIGICLLAVGVVVDAAAVFTERRTLQAAADSVALAGAQAIDLRSYYDRGAAGDIALQPTLVRDAVERQARRLDGGAHVESVSVIGGVVRVRMSGSVRPPFSGWFTPGGRRTLEVEAAATLSYRP